MPDPRNFLNRTPDPVLYAGTVANTASSDDDRVRIRLPAVAVGFTTSALTWAPRPDGVRPHAGDRALVGIDDQGNEWLVAFSGDDA